MIGKTASQFNAASTRFGRFIHVIGASDRLGGNPVSALHTFKFPIAASIGG